MDRYFVTFPTAHVAHRDDSGNEAAYIPDLAMGGRYSIEVDVNSIIAFNQFTSEGRPYTRLWLEGTSVQLDVACSAIEVIAAIGRAGGEDGGD